MKRNSIDDYVNNLKPLAEQEAENPGKTTQANTVPAEKKKNSSKTFTWLVAACLSVFAVVFVVNIYKSGTRPSILAYDKEKNMGSANKDNNNAPEKKTPKVATFAPKANAGQLAKQAVPLSTPDTASTPSAATTKPAVTAPQPVAVKQMEVGTSKLSTVAPATPNNAKPVVVSPSSRVAASPAAKNTPATKPVTSTAASVPAKRENVQRPSPLNPQFKSMAGMVNPMPAPSYSQTLAAAPKTSPPVIAEKPVPVQVVTEDFKKPKENRKETIRQQEPKRALATVTKQPEPVITIPVAKAEPVKRISAAAQVASLPDAERLARARALFNQQQWYDACDIYRREMTYAGHSKATRQEAVVRTAQCYYKLGYKSTADHLLEVVISEGGKWKKEAKQTFEAYNK